MKKIFKRLFAIVGISTLLLLLLLAVLAHFFEDQVGEKVLSTVNEQLKTELTVNEFDLSILSSFPNVGANLIGVQLKGTDDEMLLDVEQISFRIGLWSLLSSNINVKSVVISNGAFNVNINHKGEANYDVLIASEDEGEEEPESNTGIVLSKAQLEDIKLVYQDRNTKNNALVQVEEAEFSGSFSSSQFLLESEASVRIGLLELEGDSFLAGQNFSYEADIQVNTTEGTYQLNKVAIKIGELPLAASGIIEEKENHTDVDLLLESNDGDLASIINLLPARYRSHIAEIDTRGDFQLQTTVQGRYSPTELPAIEGKLRFANGKISADKMSGAIKDVAFLATFTNGSRRKNSTSIFELQDLSGYYQGEEFKMNLSVENLDAPEIDFSANGKIGVGVLVGLTPLEGLSDGSGNIEFDQLSLKGSYEDMIRSYRMERVDLSGQVFFNNAALEWQNEQLEISKGHFSLADNTMTIDQLMFVAPGTEMTFSGTAKNVLPVLFADSLNSKKAVLEFNARLDADEIDIDQLMALQAPSEEIVEEAEARGQVDSLSQAEIEGRAFTAQFLKGQFDANITSYNFNEVVGSDFTGSLQIANNKLTIKGKTNAMNGELELDGEMDIKEKPEMEVKMTCNNIDMYEFLSQNENFGQEVLVADNLSGTMNARILVRLYWDQLGELLYDKMRVWAAIGLKDGELKDFAMLEDFSTFVNIQDLRSISFSNVENFLEIRDQRMFIPAMFIQSNALNLTISGEHSFEQNIAYYIKVNAGQIVADRFRQHDPSLRPKPARRNGFFNLYYSILGSIDQFSINADKRRVKSDFEQSELRKRTIRDELERAFNTVIELVDEPTDWRDIPEYNQDIDEDNPVFLDEINGGGL